MGISTGFDKANEAHASIDHILAGKKSKRRLRMYMYAVLANVFDKGLNYNDHRAVENEVEEEEEDWREQGVLMRRDVKVLITSDLSGTDARARHLARRIVHTFLAIAMEGSCTEVTTQAHTSLTARPESRQLRLLIAKSAVDSSRTTTCHHEEKESSSNGEQNPRSRHRHRFHPRLPWTAHHHQSSTNSQQWAQPSNDSIAHRAWQPPNLIERILSHYGSEQALYPYYNYNSPSQSLSLSLSSPEDVHTASRDPHLFSIAPRQSYPTHVETLTRIKESGAAGDQVLEERQ
ncbi:hypothetical protein DOTSEDRAFT_83327 [Dothistroma septosporum NZE10]|uniref:Uncharacterized protein n=1 Tax=Dothistroma septosporum (strain NZE10 / CBS 128990) TaxID=675120 RepID=M2YL36_DOTSN|nr:hypothetical protein DOTSEDRAFT_83327 [Dothistroma septosporum NZE10]